MKKTKKIGIIGGLGPEATADIFQKILKLTLAKKDADHLRIFIDNNPHVPNRIKAVLGDGPSPLPDLVKMARGLERQGADFLIMPCVTASYYIPEIRREIKIPFLSIIDETVDFIFNIKPRIEKVGILATEATMRMGVLHKALITKKFQVVDHENHADLLNKIIPTVRRAYYHLMAVDVDDELSGLQVTRGSFSKEVDEKIDFSVAIPSLSTMRKKVMKATHGRRGVKAGYRSEPHRLLKSAAVELRKLGAQVIILACTEIPLVLKDGDVAGVRLIDPVKVLAKRAIEYAKE